MTKQELFDFMNKTVAFTLATVDGEEPRVRTMMLYKADDTGIYFHTGPFKAMYRQIMQNPSVQLCFYDPASGLQVRVRGKLEQVSTPELKREVASHPSRAFMQAWKAHCATEEEFYAMFDVFCLKGGVANVWTFQTNFAPKEDIAL